MTKYNATIRKVPGFGRSILTFDVSMSAFNYLKGEQLVFHCEDHHLRALETIALIEDQFDMLFDVRSI